MAKDRKRGNREARKPKKIKPIVAAPPTSPTKAQLTAVDLPKRKG